MLINSCKEVAIERKLTSCNQEKDNITAFRIKGVMLLNCFDKLLFYCIMYNQDSILLGEDLGS